MIKELISTKSNGLNVRLFEYDIEDEQSFNELKEYLMGKVKNSKIHNQKEYDIIYYGSKNLKPEFIERLNARIAEITIPQRAKIPHFDVRRERVTEWMAQFLLEEKYDCRFYDEADKRMNIEPVELDKHTPGIDVPGITVIDDKIKFVICEVKASEDKNIPCSSVQALSEDIQKAIDNKESRVTKEILQYIHGIKNVKFQDEELQRIIDFLLSLIANSSNNLVDNLIFFPVLLRNNEKISINKDANDFKDFTIKGTKQIENIVLSFLKPFNNFSNEIYKEAIGDE